MYNRYLITEQKVMLLGNHGNTANTIRRELKAE